MTRPPGFESVLRVHSTVGGAQTYAAVIRCAACRAIHSQPGGIAARALGPALAELDAWATQHTCEGRTG